ncbi:MAG TPA: hypothetical protein VGB34_00210 [Candidatus Limnocylindria bacterium]|jgi:hypothetical protein
MTLGLLLVGCSTGRIVPHDTPPPPSEAGPQETPTIDVATLDPCSLLVATTAAEVLGPEVGPGVPDPESAAGTAGCTYQLDADGTSLFVIVMRESASGLVGEELLESLPPDSGAEELHGVGDVSWFGHCPVCPRQSTTTLTVIAAPLQFSLAFADAVPSPARRIQAEAMARRVIEEFGL